MGRKGSSGMSGGGGGSSASSSSITSAMKRFDAAPFEQQGKGQWTLDTGFGGGVIIDETGGSRDPMHGMGGKIYSAKAWDSNYDVLMDGDAYSSLNAAKKAIKDTIKRNEIYG